MPTDPTEPSGPYAEQHAGDAIRANQWNLLARATEEIGEALPGLVPSGALGLTYHQASVFEYPTSSADFWTVVDSGPQWFPEPTRVLLVAHGHGHVETGERPLEVATAIDGVVLHQRLGGDTPWGAGYLSPARVAVNTWVPIVAMGTTVVGVRTTHAFQVKIRSRTPRGSTGAEVRLRGGTLWVIRLGRD